MINVTGDHLHHAYFLLCSHRGEGLISIQQFLREHIPVHADVQQDMLVMSFDRFSIDDVRDLKDVTRSKPINRRICILSIGLILHDAQHALLKLFEDPPTDTHFFIISETDAYLLPTLRSRLYIDTYTIVPEKKIDLAKKFLEAPLADKLEIAQNLSREGTEEVRRFLDRLEELLIHKKEISSIVRTHILQSKEFLLLPSAHKKAILETCALELS